MVTVSKWLTWGLLIILVKRWETLHVVHMILMNLRNVRGRVDMSVLLCRIGRLVIVILSVLRGLPHVN